MEKEDLAKWLHYTYEDIAYKEGWQTNAKCQCSFEALPIKNKLTMLHLAERLLSEFQILKFDAPVESRSDTDNEVKEVKLKCHLRFCDSSMDDLGNFTKICSECEHYE